MNTLGETVRKEREAHGLTQSQLGDLSGTGLNFVSQLERGKRTVRLDKLLSVLQVLGLELKLCHGKRGISSDLT
jgi:y4mF family transcriptional regulator